MDPIEHKIDRLERLNEEARLAARDFRFALRGLRRSPGFALIAVLTLALGIGANAAIFTWVHAELLAALPYRAPDQLVAINETSSLNAGRTVSDTYPDFLDWRRDEARVFDGLAWVQTVGFNLSGAGAPELANGAAVSANYFDLLGVAPRFGRIFAAGEHQAVVSAALARRQFGAPEAAVGRRLDLSGVAYTVAGVLPPAYRDPNRTDILVPAERYLSDHPGMNDRGDHGDNVVLARLFPGVSLQAALASQRAEMARLAAAYPETNVGEGAVVLPLRTLFVGSDAPMLWLLFAAVGLVLLIACANVAGLMLVRTAARRQEWAVRAALGASRLRLLRQILIESLTMATFGGALGIGLALLALRALQSLASNNAATPALRLDAPVVAFAAGLCALAAVGFGLAPARQAARLGLLATTRVTSAARGRNLLVASEVALALMLTAAAGLMLTSFARLMAVNPGFRSDHVLDFETNFAGPRYASGAARIAAMQAVLNRLAALPGVSTAAVGTNLPLSGNHDRGNVTIVGRPIPARGHFPHPDFHAISPGYLATLGLPLLRGRDFNLGDTAQSLPVALVSATFAKTYWQGESAVGRQFWLGSQPSADPHDLITVVGVVNDTKQYALDAATRIEIYLPFTQSVPSAPDFILCTAVAPMSLAAEATAALHASDAALPATNIQSMDQIVAASVANPRSTMWLLALFGALALLLAMLGIYGVVSHVTQQRTRELGVRLALGARPGAIAALVLGGAMRWVGLGIALGLIGALASGRLLAALLFGVTPTDPFVLASASVVLALAALAACLAPLRRALRVDPVIALRSE